MGPKISLTARRALSYRGQAVAAGASFTAQPLDALSMTYLGLASFGTPPTASEPTVTITVPARSTAVPAKRTYRRRDMKAEE